MYDIHKLKKRLRKTGLPAGVLIKSDEEPSWPLTLSVIDFDDRHIDEKKLERVEECFVYKDLPSTTWINIDGTQSPEIVGKIGECFGIHPLVLEDIMTSGQRPKYEDYGEYVVVILKMLYPGSGKHEIVDEQLSLLVGKNYVISFQEKPGDPFDIIRDRIRNSLGRIRKAGADYLAYSLMDTVIDNYFIVLEKLGEEIEILEEETVEKPGPETLSKIHDLKRALIFFRKFVWPLREVLGILNRSDSNLVQEATQVYFRDIYDHVIQLIDAIETYRDLVASNIEIYLSNISNKTNETMKRLTMVATIFMPLSTIAGIGGMSEWSMMTGSTNWIISYPLFIGGLVVIGIFTYRFFKWRRWI
jgi:magnesium transporter